MACALASLPVEGKRLRVPARKDFGDKQVADVVAGASAKRLGVTGMLNRE